MVFVSTFSVPPPSMMGTMTLNEEFVKDKTFSVMLKLLGALKIQKFNLTQVFRTKY